MADKNNIADENYLDNLLKAITGETDEEATDKVNEDELDFESAIKDTGLDEAFLSDFEKEFFDDDESKMLDDMFGQGKKDDSESKKMSTSDNPFDFDNGTNGGATSDAQVVSTDNEDLEQLHSGLATDMGETSVEEDLQGLYGILGVDNVAGSMSEKTEDEPKKKGLFGRNKKEKTPKKEKKSKKEKSNKADEKSELETVAFSGVTEEANVSFDNIATESTQNIDSALDGFDVEALFNSADSFGGTEAGFEMPEGLSLDGAETISFGSDENGDLTFGLDDSGFGGISENENDMLIRQMDEGALDDDELLDEESGDSKKKKKKEKKKKEKKEKKPKDKGAKKAKKPKKEKEPKVKKPKAPEEVINVPVVAIVFMLSFVVVAVVAAKMGGDYYFYQEKIYDAVALYVDTDQTDIDAYERRYSEAYTLLSGMEMRNKEHQAFFDQVQTIMFMDRHYEAYKGYMLLENFDNGLDSLIKAVKMYDKYQNVARELGCFDDMTVILNWVSNKLNDVYGITESKARELSMLTDDREYAAIVREIAGEAEAKYFETKVEKELK